MVEPDAFTVGEDLAVTPGAVVYRNEVFELIQYTPQTEKVWTVPLLMVPPVINKFYILDLAPGRSMVEYLLRQGHQVFAISWRNPTAAQRSWGCDTYGGAIVDALGHGPKGHGLGERPCSGVVLGRDSRGHDRRTSECDGRGRAHRQPDVDGDRPGSGTGGLGRRRRRDDRQTRDCALGAQGLPRRQSAGRGVRLAASHRPGVAVLGQQLSAGPVTGSV